MPMSDSNRLSTHASRSARSSKTDKSVSSVSQLLKMALPGNEPMKTDLPSAPLRHYCGTTGALQQADNTSSYKEQYHS
jgi:hypothetical protein